MDQNRWKAAKKKVPPEFLEQQKKMKEKSEDKDEGKTEKQAIVTGYSDEENRHNHWKTASLDGPYASLGTKGITGWVLIDDVGDYPNAGLAFSTTIGSLRKAERVLGGVWRELKAQMDQKGLLSASGNTKVVANRNGLFALFTVYAGKRPGAGSWSKEEQDAIAGSLPGTGFKGTKPLPLP